MKKKDYQKPMMKVVKSQLQTQLMTESNPNSASRNDYGTANEGIDPNELEDGEWSWN